MYDGGYDFATKFWAEAIKCASYIQNRVPHKQLDGMTPFEAWSGHKPDVTHFRIYGSKAWARIRTEKQEGFATPKPRVTICWVF